MRVRVETNPKRGIIDGANGCFNLHAIEIWGGGVSNGIESPVFIDGIGKKGKAIKGGFVLMADEMDRLARAWIEAREVKEENPFQNSLPFED